MEVIEKLAPFVFLFLIFIVISAIYIFGKSILKVLMLIVRGKYFQHKHMLRYEYLVSKKMNSKLTEAEQKELYNLTESLGNLIASSQTKNNNK